VRQRQEAKRVLANEGSLAVHVPRLCAGGLLNAWTALSTAWASKGIVG
jgi:hypothetical protein